MNPALRALAAKACSMRWDTASAHTKTHIWSGRVRTAMLQFQCLPQLGHMGLVWAGLLDPSWAVGYGRRGGADRDSARHASVHARADRAIPANAIL